MSEKHIHTGNESESELDIIRKPLPDVKLVTGCGDCPFLTEEFETCGIHSKVKHIEHSYKQGIDSVSPQLFYITPEWCPLKTRPVLVKMSDGK